MGYERLDSEAVVGAEPRRSAAEPGHARAEPKRTE